MRLILFDAHIVVEIRVDLAAFECQALLLPTRCSGRTVEQILASTTELRLLNEAGMPARRSCKVPIPGDMGNATLVRLCTVAEREAALARRGWCVAGTVCNDI